MGAAMLTTSQANQTMGAFVPKTDLPSLAEQDAFLRGESGWSSAAERPLTVDYGDDPFAWFAVRTNPRCEDRAQDALAEKGFETFAPKGVKEIIHNRSKKRIEREFALLTGYIFLAMPLARSRRHWGLVRKCQGVKAPVGIGGEPIELPLQAIESLREAEAEGRLRLRSWMQGPRHDFKEGERLRIGQGPFTGFYADVIDASSRKTLKLVMEVMGRAVEIDFPVDGGLERE